MDILVCVVLIHYTDFNNETEDNLNGHLDQKQVGVLSMCLSLSVTGSQWDIGFVLIERSGEEWGRQSCVSKHTHGLSNQLGAAGIRDGTGKWKTETERERERERHSEKKTKQSALWGDHVQTIIVCANVWHECLHSATAAATKWPSKRRCTFPPQRFMVQIKAGGETCLSKHPNMF